MNALEKLKCLAITVSENVSVIFDPPKITELQVYLEFVPKMLLQPAIINELILCIT
jgi:hypothetical protein